jgi:predicted RNA binding protein YcfA (HicA-like mRNA interferase family)
VTLPLVALSGEEAVAALRRAGFSARPEAGRVILRRGGRVVVVPCDEILEPNTVRAILRAAGMDYLNLLDNLTTTNGEL